MLHFWTALYINCSNVLEKRKIILVDISLQVLIFLQMNLAEFWLARCLREKCFVPLKEIPLSASICCLIHSWSIWDIDQVVCGKMEINHKSTNIKDKLLACFIQLINLATVRKLSVNISLIQWKMSGRRLDLLINSVLLLIGYTCKFLPK